MTLMIDTPDGIAFARAAARNGALKIEIETGLKRHGQTAYAIAKDVYGFTGSRQVVSQMLDEYVQGTLTVRGWAQEYVNQLGAILNGIIDALPEGYTKDDIDRGVLRQFSRGRITEQEGNDACLLLYVDVVRQFAGNR